MSMPETFPQRKFQLPNNVFLCTLILQYNPEYTALNDDRVENGK